MDNKDFDNDLTRTLWENTDAPTKDKEEIWNNLEDELFTNKTSFEKKETIKMKKKKNPIFKFAATAAAVALLALSLQTQTGHALINQIREMFAPEKEVPQIVEGIEEENTLKLNEGKESKYVIYVDEEIYELVPEEESDLIVPRVPLGDIYPEVSMEIKQIKDKSPESLINDLEMSIKEDYPHFFDSKEVDSPVSGWMIRGEAGNQWDSPVINVYIISNQQEGSFIITQRYFLEATEGHGARFDNMLKEFYIVEDSL